MRENSATSSPNIPLPPHTHTISDWPDWDGQYRFIWADARDVASAGYTVTAAAPQDPTGKILLSADGNDTYPLVHLDTLPGADGTMTLRGARELAETLIAVVAQAAEWVQS